MGDIIGFLVLICLFILVFFGAPMLLAIILNLLPLVIIVGGIAIVAMFFIGSYFDKETKQDK